MHGHTPGKVGYRELPLGSYWWFGLCVKAQIFEDGLFVPMLHTLLWREYTRCLAIRPVITKCGTGVSP